MDDKKQKGFTDLKYLKPRLDFESPITIKAMNILGISLEDFIKKTKDSFKEPGRSDEIVSLRYNNFVNRYNSTLQNLTKKVKELSKRSIYYPIRPKTSNVSTPSNNYLRRGTGQLQTLKSMSQFQKNNLHPSPAPKGDSRYQDSKILRPNNSMPRMQDSKSIVRTQYNKIMHNFEKEQRVNNQKIKECLEMENRRKVMLRIKDKNKK